MESAEAALHAGGAGEVCASGELGVGGGDYGREFDVVGAAGFKPARACHSSECRNPWSFFILWNQWKSEWVCFEHQGYARRKAEQWWTRRSPDPIPDTAEQAVDVAHGGGVAFTETITVRSVAGEPYESIIDYDLGAIPEPLEVPAPPAHGFDDGEMPF